MAILRRCSAMLNSPGLNRRYNQEQVMIKPEEHTEHKQENAEAADFHARRMHREMKLETKKESAVTPEGNYEYEQLIAEEANFNIKPMIEEAAYFIAAGRDFAPGNELSDWLQAEIEVERSRRSPQSGTTCSVGWPEP
jgi:hypothetical protein